jgi:putative oxidoreductase
MHPRTREKLLRVISIVLGVFFVFEGVLKFTPVAAVMFAGFGYPDWFRYLIGVTEVGAGVLLFFPKYVWQAAAGLLLIMFGAIISHIRAGEAPISILPAVVAVFLGVIGYFWYQQNEG